MREDSVSQARVPFLMLEEEVNDDYFVFNIKEGGGVKSKTLPWSPIQAHNLLTILIG